MSGLIGHGDCLWYVTDARLQLVFRCVSIASGTTWLPPADERVGCIQALLRTKEAADAVRSQLKAIVRPMYSNPPLHGAYVVSTILNDLQLYQEWYVEGGGSLNGVLPQLYQEWYVEGVGGWGR